MRREINPQRQAALRAGDRDVLPAGLARAALGLIIAYLLVSIAAACHMKPLGQLKTSHWVIASRGFPELAQDA